MTLFVGLLVYGKVSGVGERFDLDAVRSAIEGSGPIGVVVYLAIFAAGVFLHVPGVVFIAAGILAWGRVAGFAIGYAGGLCAVTASFAIVRAIGGRPLAEVQRPLVKRMLAQLEAKPIRTVAMLRTVLPMAAALNYTLALTGIRYRDYLAGTAIGFLVPLTLWTVLFDTLFAWFFAS